MGDELQKITLIEYARMTSSEGSKHCGAVIGDLIRIECAYADRVYLGIVMQIRDSRMRILTSDMEQIWWSTRVKCDVLTYNKEE